MLVIPNEDGTYPEGESGGEEPTEVETPAIEEGDEPVSESAPEPTSSPEAQQLAEERERRIRLEERLAVLNEQPSPVPPKEEEPPKVFTRQQLRAAVDEGQINEDQLEEIWSKQNREQTVRDTQKLMDERDRTRTTENIVDTETAKYIAAYPDVKKVNSSIWQKVKSEYDFLRQLGDSDSPATELKALRSALGGNPTRIPERTAERRETPGDASGSQGGGGGDRPVDIWNRVPKHLKAYYKDQVAQGFKTLEDVKKDIPYMAEKH